MIVDLASMKARAEALRRHAGGTDYAAQVIADNLVLVAEVDRLRGLLLAYVGCYLPLAGQKSPRPPDDR